MRYVFASTTTISLGFLCRCLPSTVDTVHNAVITADCRCMRIYAIIPAHAYSHTHTARHTRNVRINPARQRILHDRRRAHRDNCMYIYCVYLRTRCLFISVVFVGTTRASPLSVRVRANFYFDFFIGPMTRVDGRSMT